jgi:DNA-binding transcriptional ArsR family regulator
MAACDADNTGETPVWVNRYPTSADVEQAAEGQPVAMSLTRAGTWLNPVFVTLPWDLDAKKYGAEAVALAEALFSSFFESCGVAMVAATSGPDGGRHLWTACPEGLPKALVDRIAAASYELAPGVFDTSVWSRGQAAVRPPGAPHRNGGRSRLDAETPADIDVAIELMRAGTPRAAFELLAERLEEAAAERRALVGDCGQPAPASPAADDPEAKSRPFHIDPVTGQASGLKRSKRVHTSFSTEAAMARILEPYDDPSANCARVLVGLVLHGWQLADIAAVADSAAGLEHLRSERIKAGASARRRLGKAEREMRLRRQVDKAVRYAALLPAPTSPAEEDQAGEQRRLVEVAVCLAIELIDGEEPGRWGGRYRPSGPADRATVNHALLTMIRVGEWDVELPCRPVARQIGRHHDTAARALWRLAKDAVYLVQSAPAAGPHGARYALPAYLMDEARARLAAYDASTDQSGADQPDPTIDTDETAGQDHDRGEAALQAGAPTQGNPPPPQGEGWGSGVGRARGPVISDGTEQTPKTYPGMTPLGPQHTPGASLSCLPQVPNHPVTAAFETSPGSTVTTDERQDQQRPPHDHFALCDPAAARRRLESELRIWSADLFAHGTAQYADLGRHAAWTLVVVSVEVPRRGRGLTEAEIAETTGLTVPKVRRHLAALRSRDLVARSPRDGGWYATGVDVADVDQGEGAGTAARRAARHVIDAAVWAWWQAELEFLRMDRKSKRSAARFGRRHPHGQGQVERATPETIVESVSRLRYPRKAASITQNSDGHTITDLVPDHAEAARIVARLLAGEQAGPVLAPVPTPPGDFREGDLADAPDFVREALAARNETRNDARRHLAALAAVELPNAA